MKTEEYFPYWTALFYLAALPSTVSSSVVMVSIAKGNVPGAIFNASISGLIGMIATPLWMALFLSGSHGDMAFGTIFLKLFLQVLFPVLLGLGLHRYGKMWAEKYKNALRRFDKGIILMIVYNSFRRSFSEGLFQDIPWSTLLSLGGTVIILFFLVMGISKWFSQRLGFSLSDQITAQFCGSKKSLVHGTVFSNVLFTGMPYAGLYLVPIMLYHAFQLFYVSLLAEKYGQKNSGKEVSSPTKP
ncbi:hypothetical protein GCM10023331_30980 [Algivirga pacifica]|uniref:Bile acid:sodium symporter n=2 Tax=Algivirga pacifica TaxID=1162670 RepID=A0ABP9DLG2_9BACT